MLEKLLNLFKSKKLQDDHKLVLSLDGGGGSWFGGRFYDLYGSYDVMWWICVGLGFASAAMHFPIYEKPLVKKYT